MTRDDILRMAREAGAAQILGLSDEEDFALFGNAAIQRFTQLVAAHEREEIAKDFEVAKRVTSHPAYIDLMDGLAAAIRNRGNA